MSNFHSKWKQYLQEAQQDAKVLRNINIKALQKEVPQGPEEETRDYFARIQAMERTPEYLNPIFPQGLVDWIESLPDNHFPREGRKRFAKWLGNAIYTRETTERNNLDSVDNPEELNIYNNDVRYIADYLNGSQEIPGNVWEMNWQSVFNLSEDWHEELKRGIKYTGEYKHKEVVYEFDNGFTIVDVNTEHDLETEGDLMGHCVGGYCDDVAEGIVTIYSLRDKRNKPHATIEVTDSGFVEQIKGKGNDAPAEKYRGMIRQWLQTTEFDYSNSEDYLNLLSDEEIKELIVSGKLQKARVKEVLRSTESSELIDFFIGQVEAIGPVYGGSDIEPVLSISTQVLVSELARNHNFSGEQAITLAKINLNLRQPALGRQLGSMIGANSYGAYPGPERKFSTVEVATRIWQELGEELKQGALDEKLYYMETLMSVSELDAAVKREIVEHLISEPFMEKAASIPGNSNAGIFAVYGSILQLYMKSPRADKQLVRKLYTMQRDERFVELIQAKDRLSATAVTSPGMSDELVDEIIEDIKSGARQSPQSTHWIDIITSPQVSDSKKIEMLNVGKADTRYHSENLSGIGLPTIGNADQLDPMLKWSYTGKIQSRRFVEAAREAKFSRKVVKYMIDSGMFDPHYARLWADQQSKLKGKRPDLESIPYDSREGVEIIKKARDMALQNLRGGAYTSVKLDTITTGDKAPWLNESNNKVGAEINNYFRKNIMTKSDFYDTIKEQLGINEEKGRSRQRGIYKFYCMVAYGLTADGEKTRGLDDILADMRALPNVTIVTVAVRNQKIAEGRYIAGLAIKFIPSTPGDLNTPENVKARIVRDIKRLTNVQSLFKLSTGLIRLE